MMVMMVVVVLLVLDAQNGEQTRYNTLVIGDTRFREQTTHNNIQGQM